MFVCPEFYASLLIKEFMPWLLDPSIVPNATDRTYEMVNEEAVDLVKRLKDFLKQEKIAPDAFDRRTGQKKKANLVNPVNPVNPQQVNQQQDSEQDTSRELAYPNAVGKFHKDPLGWRFIACSSSYTLRALSSWLSLTFKALMPVVHDLWKSKMAEVGVRSKGCWIAKDSGRVPSIAVLLNRNFTKAQRRTIILKTFDFSKMYTNIKLPELKEQMGKLMDWLFAI